MIGTSPADHCADPEVPGRIIGELKRTGECRIAFVGRRKDGSTFDVLMWARLDHDPDGVEIYPSTAIDVTERKRHEAALREAIRARDEFISVASHELKTPVTSLKLQFDLAARRIARGDPKVFDPQTVTQRVQGVVAQLDRMMRLIEDMLDVSRIATGRLAMRLQPEDLSDLVHELVGRFREQLAESGCDLDAHVAPGVTADIDRLRVEQVLSNLLMNALRYAPGAPVVVALRADDHTATIEVRDHGPGIDADVLPRIFEPFERGVPTGGGLGLGLFLSRRIVEAHGGRIRAESESGHGATFVVELPRRRDG